MGMLNFSQLLITKAFWGKCIDFFLDWVGNYGWAIILLTIALKLILSPMDIMQKHLNKKNARMQAIMQPELQKIQEKYPGDRNKLNQKQMELAKKYNFNMTGTCLTLLITMIISITVFSSLFFSLNSLSSKQENVAFNEIYQTYVEAQAYTQTDEQFKNDDDSINQELANSYIHGVVLDKFESQSDKYSFMWVKNVWKKDTSTSPVVNYSSFEKYMLKNGLVEDSQLGQLKANHTAIAEIIESEHKYNGCYILIILAGAVTLVAQLLQTKLQKIKAGPNAQANPTNKTMMIIMPIFMIIFASTSSALFTLYIITNSIISAVISTILELCQKKDKDDGIKVLHKQGNTEVVEYSRNYNKG